ncbi:hypothetical protein FA13DRAFT_1726336 [Coprinellus micaceus]|uniref:Transmembrane protein n=1 Tax=Coprinellus micaceus TaxID=71717 RepID=A0A4Y7TSV2_COPMI|nr:hypothetical protein FA13DRAFT_1726336 [Coprinellus micaceus]
MILVPALVALVRLVLSGVAAQGTNVTGCISEYEWTIDAAGHTPCWTAAQLYIPCGIGNKFLQAIPPDTVYLGPNSTHQDECGCSSAVYILTSACGACQSRPWVNYVSWARECPEQMKSIGYPKDVPIRVTIPEWARMNVSELAGQNFDPAKARMEAIASRGIRSGKLKAGAIAGGVLAFLTALGILIVWLIRRKRARIARLGELRARSLDLAELDHLYHDSERTAAGFLAAKGGCGNHPRRKGRTLSVSMVRGRSWHLLESSDRQLSVSSGGHGHGQAYVLIIPEHNTVTPGMREVATRGQPMSVDVPPPSYQSHTGRLSIDSLSPPHSLSQGFFDPQGVCQSPVGM